VFLLHNYGNDYNYILTPNTMSHLPTEHLADRCEVTEACHCTLGLRTARAPASLHLTAFPAVSRRG